jgi:hypothetical protein
MLVYIYGACECMCLLSSKGLAPEILKNSETEWEVNAKRTCAPKNISNVPFCVAKNPVYREQPMSAQ